MSQISTKQGKGAFTVFTVIFAVLFLILIARLFYLQIIKHDHYEEIAVRQQTWDVTIDAPRGSILDRNGNELASSATAYKVLLAPALIKTEEDRQKIVTMLCETLDLDWDTVYKKASRNTQYVEIKRRVEKDVVNGVTEFLTKKENEKYSNIIWVSDDPKRYYPHGNLLSTVLGIVGIDNQGLEGIELMYDDVLSGIDGRVIAARTASGKEMPFEYEKYVEPQDGNTLVLTVDIEFQYILEKYLEQARVEHNVQNRVAGIITNVKTGEVLAMSVKPDFDPNNYTVINDALTLQALDEARTENGWTDEQYRAQYNSVAQSLRKNKIISEQYYPGSTFKIFTGAMALEEGLVSLTETFNCVGHLKVGDRTIHCAKREGHGVQTFKDGIANSCNPVFMTLGARIGAVRFYDYITLFGLRDKTNVGLPGEQSGYHYTLATLQSGPVYLATSSFGQNFKITAMQLIAAVGAVANDGQYMQPYIIKEIRDADGNIVESFEPQVVRQVVSEETSDLLCEYLEYSVQKGKTGYMEGYRIAGKTGTSEKLDEYTEDDQTLRVASFICFAPADDPEIAVLVVVDEPDSQIRYGSYIAAPLGRDIMVECLQHLGVSPDYGDSSVKEDISVPKLTGMPVSDAVKELKSLGLVGKTYGDGDTVLYQLPSAWTELIEGNSVLLYTSEEKPATNTTVPSLIGKTAAECNLALINANLNLKVVGENINYPGTVAVAQSHDAGETVKKGTIITVTFG